jgi:hypothetical protein
MLDRNCKKVDFFTAVGGLKYRSNQMPDYSGDSACFVVLMFILAVLAFIVFVFVAIAVYVAIVAAIVGVLWGTGHALLNYIRSIKENIIDSNLKP